MKYILVLYYSTKLKGLKMQGGPDAVPMVGVAVQRAKYF